MIGKEDSSTGQSQGLAKKRNKGVPPEEQNLGLPDEQIKELSPQPVGEVFSISVQQDLLIVIHQRDLQFSSVTQWCLTLCDLMNRSTPGLPVHHQLPEFTQTHVHRVRDAIQPSHPLSSPSPPAPNPSQHQSLFQ